MKQKHWLIKSEPETFGIIDLQNSPDQTTIWDGVRNYQARNFLRDEFNVGDLAFFYHSNAEPPGIAGIVKVTETNVIDPSQFDPNSPYYDAKSKAQSPTWITVRVKLVKVLTQVIPLSQLRSLKSLKDMLLLQKGSRLSVQPVSNKHWNLIEKTFGI